MINSTIKCTKFPLKLLFLEYIALFGIVCIVTINKKIVIHSIFAVSLLCHVKIYYVDIPVRRKKSLLEFTKNI